MHPESKAAWLIKANERKKMPWKNGRGITNEIAIELDQNTSRMIWRLSSAPVNEAGPFSLYPSYERLLAITEGQSLLLSSASRVLTATPLHPLRFSGDENFSAALPDGPIVDLGLIFDPQLVKAELHVLSFTKARSFELKARRNFFTAAKGEFACSLYPGEEQFFLSEEDSLAVVGARKDRILLLEPLVPEARIVATEIFW